MSQLVLEKIKARFPDAVLATHAHRGDETVVLRKAAIAEVTRLLREDAELAFDLFIDLFGVDTSKLGVGANPAYPYARERFEVVYHFYSTTKKHRIRLKVPVAESDCVVPSITAVWLGANWFERECFDMYGVRFEGHPGLKRLLMYEGFVGHPLRKDYPAAKRQPRIGVPH